jgi:hypothetical protein
MHHHPGGLVDDGDVVVLIEDLQRDRLRGGFNYVRLGYLEVHDIPDRHPICRVGGVTVEMDQVALDQACRGRAAQVVCVLGQEAIQPRRRG